MAYRRFANILKGGALIGALLIAGSTPVLAYDQNNTHPALTDEIVDFYNINFPDKKLNNEEKQWLIQGSKDEDSGERPLFHFYDPIYNRGIAGGTSSKKWALASGIQANYYNSQQTGLAAFSGAPSAGDFSYQRALDDYAKGDKKRAFLAFGHVLHLLEDAGVPDHTRNDPHPPFFDEAFHQASPYEHEMAKWNPANFQISRKLFLIREKPVTFYTMESYFDKVANFSNNNFFSKDTISNKEYPLPKLSTIKKIRLGGIDRAFVVSKDRNGVEFPIAFVQENKGNITHSIFNPEIRTYILDTYWAELSKEVVLNGAGALNLFLNEAERAREEYARKPQEKTSLWAQLLSVFGVGDASDNIGTTPRVVHEGVDNVDNSQGLVTQGDNDGVTNTLPIVSPILSPSPIVSPLLSPKLLVSPMPSPELTTSDGVATSDVTEKININTANKELLVTLKGIKDAKSDAIILHRQTYGPFQKIEDVMNVSGIGQATFDEIKGLITVGDIVPTPSPVFYASGGGGGGGSSSPTPTPTPSPSPSVTPTPSPTPEPDGDTIGQVVMNEIAWMGTATSSNDEWIELYNTTASPVDLSGWTLKSLTGSTPDPQITLTGVIGPFGFYLLERTDDITIFDILADKIYTGALSDTGEILELRDASGALQDKVFGNTGWYAGNKDTDSSMERINPKTSGNNSANWSTNNGTTKNGHDAAGNPINGTPKSSNSVYVALKPSSVADLLATLNSPLSVTWTAPEDLDTLPASLSYDMRYSLTNFPDNSTWDTATKVASSSLPSVGEKGASQSASFDVAYEYGQTLYFALKTGLSGISNVATVSFPTAIDANSWAMLGKDQYHTSFATNIAGPTDPMATISWEFNADPDNTVSQPVVSADGDVYVGASDGSSNKLIKLDKNGLKQWEYATNVNIGTPAILSDGTAYFGRIGAGGVLAFTALNPDSSKKWDYNDASTVKAITVSSKGEPHFTYSSGAQDKIAILNPDGSEKITPISGTGLSGFSPVVLEDGTIIVARRESGNQFFTKYSADGTQLWDLAYTGANGSMQSNPSYDQTTGKTYSAVGYDGGASFGFRMFVIPSDGSVLNTTVIAPANLGSGATMVAITPTKLFVGLDYSWSDPASGSKLFSLNKSDLTASWSFQAEGKINQQLAVDQAGNAYFSTQTGHLYSVDAAGNENWHISVGEPSNISPALAENGVIWGFGNRVVLIN